MVRNEAGHIVKWLLSAKRDIGVNLIRYEYETVEYEFDGTNWGVADCDPASELCGQHTYFDRILYTDATSAIADRNGPPYEIDFLRESDPLLAGSGDLVRADPIVDAGLGYVDVVVDRLARVEVKHGAAPASGTARTYNSIAARYEFNYGTGRFGKSLLTEMIQGVDDPHVHELEYYDDLTGTTTVDGFATGVDLDTAPGSGAEGDVSDITFLDTTADVSALGGGETNAGSGNLYIGFNPISPSKTFSVGVGLELSGGDTEAIVEWTDLNGDNLPDKVFLDGSTVKFRLNTTGPAGAGTDGDWPLGRRAASPSCRRTPTSTSRSPPRRIRWWRSDSARASGSRGRTPTSATSTATVSSTSSPAAPCTSTRSTPTASRRSARRAPPRRSRSTPRRCPT